MTPAPVILVATRPEAVRLATDGNTLVLAPEDYLGLLRSPGRLLDASRRCLAVMEMALRLRRGVILWGPLLGPVGPWARLAERHGRPWEDRRPPLEVPHA